MNKEEQNCLQNYSHQILNILVLELEYALKNVFLLLGKP